MPAIETIAFDADDTLWHNQPIFEQTHERFRALLAPFCAGQIADAHLLQTEVRNLAHYGYSIKGFTLSMIETAIQLTHNAVGGREIAQILDWGKAMRNAPIANLPGVAEVLAQLSPHYRLMCITKGDLFDQESKMARSGLGDLFHSVEIVSEKDAQTYRRILARHKINPATFLMVGNSVKSDILPVIAIGGSAVHIAYHTTWAHELVTLEANDPKQYAELEHIGELPAYLARWQQLNREEDARVIGGR